MIGIELDNLCEEWLEKNFPSFRKHYNSYFWIIPGAYPPIFQRVMRRMQIDWDHAIGDATADQVELGEARIALGLTHTAVPGCFEKAFADGELAV